MLEKAGYISHNVSLWSSPIVTVPKKAQPREQSKKHLFVDYHALDSLLPLVVKAHSKVQGILLLVPLPEFDEFYVC